MYRDWNERDRDSRSQGNLPAVRQQNEGMARRGDSDWMSPFESFAISPWQMMRRMQEDMDRLFGQFFTERSEGGRFAPGFGQMQQQWQPSVDVSEGDKEFCLEADLPGVKAEDIDVQVQDHHLILRSEMRQGEEQPQDQSQTAQQQRQYRSRERRYGYFERAFALPDNVNEDDISCDFKDGVLTVHLPKMTEQARPQGRRIPIGGSVGAQTGASGAPSEGRTDQMAGSRPATAATKKTDNRPAANAQALNEEERHEQDLQEGATFQGSTEKAQARK